jgi:DNA-binding NarL/FixJ family response regulator
VATPHHRRRRVLIGDLDPISRVGMTGMLAEHGAEVLVPEHGDVVDAARQMSPDTVVLDLDNTAAQDLSTLVREACPHAKVVLWGRDEDVVEVLDPGATSPRFVLGGDPDELRAELLMATPMTPAEDS